MKKNIAEHKAKASRSPSMIAWHVRRSGKRAYWDRIGAVFAHNDGRGYDVVLETMPVDGRVTLRAPAVSAEERCAAIKI